jgi:hypothetical protein
MSVTGPIPAGWYPDPSGERQWRVWNGTDWSTVTRPYGEPTRPSPAARLGVDELATLGTLRRLTQFGVLAYYAGVALLVGIVAHWPGHAHPESPRVASAALGAAIGLVMIGSISFATSVRALRGRWSLDAVIPVLNTFAASWWMSRRLGAVNPGFRLFTDAVITVGFVALSPSQPWVGVALASVAFTQLARTYMLIDAMTTPGHPDATS